jgi:hypothetical protein
MAIRLSGTVAGRPAWQQIHPFPRGELLMTCDEKGSVIAAICRTLAGGSLAEAESLVRRDYPFDPASVTVRRFRPVQYTKTFVRDGFIDRYSGERLIFPPVLRVLSFTLPTVFPYHPNWKTDETHPAYWEVSATLDHVIPVSRGGVDDESNWVTTSMRRNAAKMSWTLAELGWRLQPPGAMSEWDGMISWFLEYTSRHPEAIVDNAVRQWRRAAEVALTGVSSE